NSVVRLISLMSGTPKTRRQRLGIQAEIVGIVCRTSRTEPRGPSKLASRSESQRRHILAPQHQLGIPIELEAEIQPHPVEQLRQRCAAWKEALVLAARERPEADPELALPIPDATAEGCTRPEHRPLMTEVGALGGAEIEPVPDEFFDRHGH